MTLLGLIDDKLQIRARMKFLFQIAVATTIALFFYRFNTLTIPGVPPIALGVIAPLITVFWITAMLNALNMTDGVDGLCATTSIATLCVIATIAYCIDDTTVFALSSIGAAATGGFLFYNWRPARIYLGDAGSLSLAMLNAILLVSLGLSDPISFKSELTAWEPFSFQLPLATLILFYPSLEIALSVSRRFLKGKPIGSADKEHIHHLFLHRGWKAPQICIAVAIISLIMGGVAIASVTLNRGIASWLLASGALAVGIGATYLGIFEMFHPRRMRVKRTNFLIANHFMNMQKLKLDLTRSAEEVYALLNQTCTELGIDRYTIELEDLLNDTSHRQKWIRSSDTHGNILSPLRHSSSRLPFSDRCESTSSKTFAEWTFEQVESEDDLDVEYRVLFSDFMLRVIDRIDEVFKERTSATGHSLPATDISANNIRRRKSDLDADHNSSY